MPLTTDGYIDLLQIDAGQIDGDSNLYTNVFKMRRSEQATMGSASRVDE